MDRGRGAGTTLSVKPSECVAPPPRSELRRLLTRAGHDVAEAGAVHEAETDYELDSFELILSDLRLPGAPGADVIAKAPGVPVLIMTSYATVRSAVEAMNISQAAGQSLPKTHSRTTR
ncbi:response regulator [Archangium sp.]|uniref:response regulator n=1 Tax=Archangium sp. TaxID=1872627 RepID=UPI00389B2F3A